MKLLLVKTTSFGDILHAFPALEDAWRSVDKLVCDWVVEEPYASIPVWHPAVRDVIPVSMRGWRRAPWVQHVPGVRSFIRHLRRERYDLVLDAQGLMKSAVLARLARGRRVGYARHSIREPLAAHLYHETVEVDPGGHAVDRHRQLFAGALGYGVPRSMEYGLRLPAVDDGTGPPGGTGPYLVFIPGTTWPSKQWPANYWHELAVLASDAGWRVQIPCHTESERATAQGIVDDVYNADLRPSLSIDQLAQVLHDAMAVVSVDSGPGHLAAAVGTPGVSIYGATDPALTGVRGPGHVHLRADFECSPCLQRHCRFADQGQIHPDCYATVSPQRVWSTLRQLIQDRKL